MGTKKSKLIWVVLITLLVIAAVFSLTNCINKSTEVNFSDFYQLVSLSGEEKDENGQKISGSFTKDTLNNIVATDDNALKTALDKTVYTDFEIKKVVLSTYNINFTVLMKGENGKATKSFTTNYTRTADVDFALQELLTEKGISFSATDPNAGSIWSSLLPILGYIVIAVVFFILIMQTQGGTKGAMNFAKTNAKLSHDIKVRFSDVAGAEEEKEELEEVVDFLKNPKKFSQIGARVPKGVLLVGPPGTGKTLFAKAVAGEAGVPFFSISGSDFVEMFVGVGASRVRDLFDVAKKSMPCIVFIDEIDAVGRRRGTGLGGGNDEKEQTLNQLLVQMDGFESNDGIIVIAATNRSDILDPALLRPGRFDRQIYVNIPDVKGREAILKVHARNKPLARDVNFKTVARMTSGFSGADLENLLNEAAILAARENRTFITNKDLYEGINKVVLGPQKKSRLVTETDKRITAYHESGHAIVAKLLPNCDPVHEVSIIPRGGAAGYTMTRPDSDDNHLTKSKIIDAISMMLGGRVAEEIIIKDISAGASNDIQRATEAARSMVTEWGMSEKIGPISYSSNGQTFIGRDMMEHVNYSEEIAKIIDEEVKAIIDTALNKTRKLLSENKVLLENMARLLIERETIFTEEVDMIMAGKSVEEIMNFMDENEKSISENPFERGNPTIIKETKKEEEKSPSAKRKTTKRTTEKQEENSLKEEANNEKGE